jgi:hypothetical protein
VGQQRALAVGPHGGVPPRLRPQRAVAERVHPAVQNDQPSASAAGDDGVAGHAESEQLRVVDDAVLGLRQPQHFAIDVELVGHYPT